jgi:transcriptional regulator with XRE-family HTH domain
MDAARVLREARRRAGISQTELAEKAGMHQSAVARLERGGAVPRVDTLERLLRACDRTLTTEPRWAVDVPRGQIRALRRVDPLYRLHGDTAPGFRPIRALRVLAARHVRFVVVGPAAARIYGAPIGLDRLDIVAQPDYMNARRLRGALTRFRTWRISVGRVVVRRSLGPIGSYELLERAALELWLERRTIRVASIDDLIQMASTRRERALLCAVREERDSGG